MALTFCHLKFRDTDSFQIFVMIRNCFWNTECFELMVSLRIDAVMETTGGNSEGYLNEASCIPRCMGAHDANWTTLLYMWTQKCFNKFLSVIFSLQKLLTERTFQQQNLRVIWYIYLVKIRNPHIQYYTHITILSCFYSTNKCYQSQE